MVIRIDREKCIACGDCAATCPFGCIEVAEKAQVKEGCTLCGACRDACGYGALIFEETPQAAISTDAYRGVWVFAEQRAGKLKSVDYELLSKGRELADALQTELCAVCLGYQVDGIDSLIGYGADKVLMLDNLALAGGSEDIYVRELLRLIQEHKPEIVLAGATSLGRSLIPRVAATLKTGLTADCTGLDIDAEKRLLLQTRPTFGGNIMATIVCPSHRPQMATVRPRVFKKLAPGKDHRGQIIKVDFKGESVTSRTKLISFVDDLAEKVKIEEADIIVSGGRGLGKPENFHLLEGLAGVLGAAVGSSRPPVDEGWISYSHQVGQTGKTVCPKLYIACGISGAVQHLAGMQTADVIVAINNDPGAPIFEVATYGIVGDLFKIVPILTEKLKQD